MKLWLKILGTTESILIEIWLVVMSIVVGAMHYLSNLTAM